MIVYKTMRADNTSHFQKTPWPLPDGSIPGDWMEVEGEAVICRSGLHGWLTEEIALTKKSYDVPFVYEMELDETAGKISTDNEKACGNRARLLRLLHDRNGPVVTLAELVWQ